MESIDVGQLKQLISNLFYVVIMLSKEVRKMSQIVIKVVIVNKHIEIKKELSIFMNKVFL